MITFALDEEQTMIRDSLRAFAAEVLAPGARAIDEAGETPADIIKQGWDFGLIAASIPEAFGGGGGERSCITNAVALEALGGGCASQAVAIMAPGQFVGALIDFGTEEQKAEHLPRFAGADAGRGGRGHPGEPVRLRRRSPADDGHPQGQRLGAGRREAADPAGRPGRDLPGAGARGRRRCSGLPRAA
jgi:alkylation response protein AidB-like acyl-CoA dehydrogenase